MAPVRTFSEEAFSASASVRGGRCHTCGFSRVEQDSDRQIGWWFCFSSECCSVDGADEARVEVLSGQLLQWFAFDGVCDTRQRVCGHVLRAFSILNLE